jgi:hypothetical protein
MKRNELRREGLRRGDPNLRPGVRINRAFGLAGGHAADDVADGDTASAFLFGLAKGGKRVRRLPRLRNHDRQRVG